MSAPYIIPFNHQPILTGASSSTYTVPSGKYARVTATLTCAAWVSARSAVNGSTGYSEGASSQSTTITIWLKAADAITVSNTNASGTSASSSLVTSVSTASILVNAATVSSISTPVSATATAGNTVTLSGSASVNYIYEEYNVIS